MWRARVTLSGLGEFGDAVSAMMVADVLYEERVFEIQ